MICRLSRGDTLGFFQIFYLILFRLPNSGKRYVQLGFFQDWLQGSFLLLLPLFQIKMNFPPGIGHVLYIFRLLRTKKLRLLPSRLLRHFFCFRCLYWLPPGRIGTMMRFLILRTDIKLCVAAKKICQSLQRGCLLEPFCCRRVYRCRGLNTVPSCRPGALCILFRHCFRAFFSLYFFQNIIYIIRIGHISSSFLSRLDGKTLSCYFIHQHTASH